jgi:hypothetical protein
MLDFVAAFLSAMILVIYAYLDHVLKKGKPSRTWATAASRWLPLMLIALAVVSGFVQYFKSRADSRQVEALNGQLGASLSISTNMQSDIRLLEMYVQSHMQWERNVFLQLGTNSTANPTIVAMLAEEPQPTTVITNGSSGLRAWALEFQRKRAQSAVQSAQTQHAALRAQMQSVADYFPLFDHTIKTLHALLTDIAKDSPKATGSVVCNYTALPSVESIIASNPYVCDIAMGANLGWHYKCAIDHNEPVTPDLPAVLRITSQSTNVPVVLTVYRRIDQVVVEVTAPNSPPNKYTGPSTNFHEPVDKGLRDLLGFSAQATGYLDKLP